jgi:hypothetical protein
MVGTHPDDPAHLATALERPQERAPDVTGRTGDRDA